MSIEETSAAAMSSEIGIEKIGTVEHVEEVQYNVCNGNHGRVQFVRLSTDQMKLLLKLGSYRVCQATSCECQGWSYNSSAPKTRAQYEAVLRKPCDTCSHEIDHHLSSVTWSASKRIKVIVQENGVFMAFLDTTSQPKIGKVNYLLLRALKRELLSSSSSSSASALKESLGRPPFEEPCIAEALDNLIELRFQGLKEDELQLMQDSAKIFLDYFNEFEFNKPVSGGSWWRGCASEPLAEDELTCKLNYFRWLMFCCPNLRDSPPYFEPSSVFGRTWLKLVFPEFRKQLLENKRGNFADKLSRVEKRQPLILNCFFEFLSALEAEISSADSLVWRAGRSFSTITPPFLSSTTMASDSSSSEINATTIAAANHQPGTIARTSSSDSYPFLTIIAYIFFVIHLVTFVYIYNMNNYD